MAYNLISVALYAGKIAETLKIDTKNRHTPGDWSTANKNLNVAVDAIESNLKNNGKPKNQKKHKQLLGEFAVAVAQAANFLEEENKTQKNEEPDDRQDKLDEHVNRLLNYTRNDKKLVKIQKPKENVGAASNMAAGSEDYLATVNAFADSKKGKAKGTYHERELSTRRKKQNTPVTGGSSSLAANSAQMLERLKEEEIPEPEGSNLVEGSRQMQTQAEEILQDQKGKKDVKEQRKKNVLDHFKQAVKHAKETVKHVNEAAQEGLGLSDRDDEVVAAKPVDPEVVAFRSSPEFQAIKKYAAFLAKDPRDHSFFGKKFKVDKTEVFDNLIQDLEEQETIQGIQIIMQNFYDGKKLDKNLPDKDKSAYHLLNTGQDVFTRVTGVKTTSIQRIDKLNEYLKLSSEERLRLDKKEQSAGVQEEAGPEESNYKPQ